MTVAPDHAARTARLQAVMRADAIAALLLTDLVNIRWLTGFTGTAGAAYVTTEGPATLIIDNRYTERAQDEAPSAVILTDSSPGWLLELHDVSVPLAVEADHLTWSGLTRLRELDDAMTPVATTGLVATLRQRKDAAEIAHLRRACGITGEAFEDALTWLAPGLSEVDIARRLIDTMGQLGAEGSAFAPIVATGPHGSRPHHDPTTRTVAAGDLVTMDFGARVAGYHADMTRTVAVGTPSPELREIHDLVRRAQDAAADSVADGVPTADVDGVCRSIISDAGHGEHFVHGTGHSVGLQIHETPFLGSKTTGTLRAGMTITVEPGVYVPGTGGVRIEDVVLVVDGSAEGVHRTNERLTTATRELICL